MSAQPPPPPGGPPPPPYGPPPPQGPPPPYGPPPPRKSRTGLIVGAVVLGVLALGGIVATVIAGLPEDAKRDETGAITGGGNVSAFDLRIGDCFNVPDPQSAVHDVGGVPCTDPHDAEVFSTFELDDGEFPGQQSVNRAVDRGCQARFADFVGLAYQKSELLLLQLYPTEQSWNIQDDREVVCAITEPNGKKTTAETLEGANR